MCVIIIMHLLLECYTFCCYTHTRRYTCTQACTQTHTHSIYQRRHKHTHIQSVYHQTQIYTLSVSPHMHTLFISRHTHTFCVSKHTPTHILYISTDTNTHTHIKSYSKINMKIFSRGSRSTIKLIC